MTSQFVVKLQTNRFQPGFWVGSRRPPCTWAFHLPGPSRGTSPRHRPCGWRRPCPARRRHRCALTPARRLRSGRRTFLLRLFVLFNGFIATHNFFILNLFLPFLRRKIQALLATGEVCDSYFCQNHDFSFYI